MLFAVGVVLALAQPGNLGDSEETAGPAATTTTTTTSTVPVAPTSTSVPTDATTTTIQGSGINNPSQPSGGTNGEISDTGMESMLGPGLVLLALGLLLRRAARPAAL